MHYQVVESYIPGINSLNKPRIKKKKKGKRKERSNINQRKWRERKKEQKDKRNDTFRSRTQLLPLRPRFTPGENGLLHNVSQDFTLFSATDVALTHVVCSSGHINASELRRRMRRRGNVILNAKVNVALRAKGVHSYVHWDERSGGRDWLYNGDDFYLFLSWWWFLSFKVVLFIYYLFYIYYLLSVNCEKTTSK